MSAIFGLGYFDGRPVPPESLGTMQAVMSSWGPDGCTLWRQDNAGLGQALLSVTPASRYEVMPLHDLENKQVLVAAARLDNRDELCDAFGIPQPERPITPDGRLLQIAFKRWGEVCPKKLYGDWSFAVWDYGRQRLFLARDQLGNTGLYYYHKPPFFAFASSPKALLALPEVHRQLNEMQLARYLLLFSDEYASETFWQDVHLLLPGSDAVVTSNYCGIDLYWRPEDVWPVCLGSDEEYLEGFLDQYKRAVRCRLDSLGPIGVMLSSGLDSGSVTALAAKALGERGERLTAFTSVPLYPADPQVPKQNITDEWPLSHTLAEQWSNIEHIPVRAESVSPITGLEHLMEIFHEPVHGAANIFWVLAIHDKAARHDVRVMLTGQLGNGTVSWDGGRDYILFQFVRGHWNTGRRSLLAWKQRHGCSWLSTLKRHILRPLLGPLWSKRHRLSHTASPPWADYAAIHSDFAQRLGLKKVLQDRYSDRSKPLPPERERLLILKSTGVIAGPFYHAIGSAFNQEIRDPTAHVPLVEYCLGLPGEQYTCKGGDRMLLRRGLHGLMPPPLLWNTSSGDQAADVTYRLLADNNQAEDLLQCLKNSPAAREFLNLSALKQAWYCLQKNPVSQSTLTASVLFMRGLAAGIFLLRM
jgi:asparagine synthase (glutamine-hydrolysing)